MPEQFLENIKKNIKREWKIAFFSAMIIGLLANLYVFLHRFPNHDSLHNFYSDQAMVTSGRFFLGPAAGISSYFDLPWIIGVLSIFYLALTTICIVELFQVRKKIAIVLIAGIVVTFPSVTSTFSYMFTADAYMLGIFLATLAVLITKKYKKFGFLIGALFVCLAVGIYQANLSVALTFATFWIIHSIFYSNYSLKVIWGNVIRSGFMVGIGMVAYLVVYKLFTRFLSVEISSYQGLDKVGSLSISDIPRRILQIIRELKTFFFRGFFTTTEVTLLEWLNLFIFIVLIVGVIALIFKNQLYKDVGKLVTLFIAVISLPFSYYIAYFASPSAFYHMLMVFSLNSVYIFVVLMYDAVKESSNLLEKMMTWASPILMVFTIFNFALIANIAYMNMELRHEKSVSFANRLVDRIEQMDDFDAIEKMAVFGNVELHSGLVSEVIPNRIPTMTGAVGETVFYKPYSYPELIESYLGYSWIPATNEELEIIEQSKEFEEMGVWPAENSVQLIGNTVVVKFENFTEQ